MGARFLQPVKKPDAIIDRIPPRLPRYVTSETLQRMGHSQEVIKTLRPKTTYVAYPETNVRDKPKFEFNNPGEKHIPSYLTGSYVVKGQGNPSGSSGLGQVRAYEEQKSDWHATSKTIEQAYSSGGAEAVAKALDLPRTPNFSTRASPDPYSYDPVGHRDTTYAVEISFNRVGAEQVQINSGQVTYGKPKPIR